MQPLEIGNAAPAPETRSAGEIAVSEELGRVDFLRMLIAQLENQDPLDPQDATEFTAQLAQFSSLDQLVSMRTAIDSLAAAQSRSDSFSAAALIGQQALVEGQHFDIPTDPAAPMPELVLDLPSSANIRSVQVLNEAGLVVATAANLGTIDAGQYTVPWTAFDTVPAGGVHSYRVTTAPGDVSPGRLVRSRVTGAALDPSGTVLLLGDVEASISSLREFGQ